MSEQTKLQPQKSSQSQSTRGGQDSEVTPAGLSPERQAEIDAKKAETDALLDEIDAVLEENAQEFVDAFVQVGGE